MAPVHPIIAGSEFNHSIFAVLLDLQSERPDRNGSGEFEDHIGALLGIFRLRKSDKGFVIPIDGRRPVDIWNVRGDLGVQSGQRHSISRQGGKRQDGDIAIVSVIGLRLREGHFSIHWTLYEFVSPDDLLH